MSDNSAQSFADTFQSSRAVDAAAQQTRHLLELSLAASNAGVWDYDVLHRCVTGDATVARLFGFPVEDVSAGRIPLKAYLRTIHPEDRSVIEQKMTEAALSNAGYEVEYRIKHLDGSICWVFARGTPEHDETGQVVSFPGVIFDITARKHDEEALRLSEERFRHLADNAPAMIWITEADGSCVYLSSLWYAFTGQTAVTSLGMGWVDAIHPDDRQKAYQVFLRANAHHMVFQTEYRLRRYDGIYHWMIDTADPRLSEDGTFLGYIGSVIDINARKQTEARERFLYHYLDSLRALTEPEQIVSKAVLLLGEHLAVDRCIYAEVEADGSHFNLIGGFVTPGTSSVVGRAAFVDFGDETLRVLRSGLPHSIEDTANDPQTAAHRFAYEAMQIGATLSIPQITSGRLVAVMAVHQRVPRRWTSDDVELVRLSATMCWEAFERARATRILRENEERLQTLYQQEQAARQQIEEASRLKDEFLATVSHELRTPLTAVLGYGQVLQYRQRDDAYTTRIVDKIVQSATVQAQLIDDLLDVSRIVTGNLRLDPRIIHFIPVIEAAIDNVRPAIDAKALQFHTDLDIAANTILGDARRLQQVVWNVLSNAAKFTPPGGTVGMQLRSVDGYAQLTISDTGQGISADFLPYVFDRFRQADSTSTRSYGGLGLGLAIVRHVVEMHGGSVQAHSDGCGKGATFTVRLPLRVRAAELPAADSARAAVPMRAYPPQLEGLRVLAVDDQPDMLELLHEILAPCGAIVKESHTARDALVTLRAWRPDILLSDIAMPADDGYWLIDRVRSLAQHEGRDTPAIALTAYVHPEDRARVLAAGFQMYLPKPVEASNLLDVIAECATMSMNS